MTRMKPIHPGETLLVWMQECGTTPATLLEAAGELRTDVAAVMHEVGPITEAVAAFLARFYDNSPTFWMNLQVRYLTERAKDLEDKMRGDN
jgi:addiction module HigA family antidote